MEDKMKHILSFSGGKDSTYLLLELIRRKYPLDEVVYFDTGWEFPAMYEHIKKCKKKCENYNVSFVTLQPEHSFDYLMFEKPVKEKKEVHIMAIHGVVVLVDGELQKKQRLLTSTLQKTKIALFM